MKKHTFSLLILAALLAGCTQETPVPTQPRPADASAPMVAEITQPTVPTLAQIPELYESPPAPPVFTVLQPIASGESVQSNDNAEIDYSHTADGYVMVRYTAETEKRLKVLVKGPSTTYSYNLPQGDWTVFPLSDGNGAYTVGVYRNISGSKYATILTASFDAQLLDEFAPFLRPNQYVNYSEATQALQTGLEVTAGLTDPLGKVEAIYHYVTTTMEYDHDKAATVKSGYLPDLDLVLSEGKGICFDYASLMAAMLRSQEVPCKLVVGYAGSTYHAWISVWTEESGWIDGVIFFDGQKWQRMDPTFASGANEETLDFIQNGTYTAKYLY